jgi:hypothetical protein
MSPPFFWNVTPPSSDTGASKHDEDSFWIRTDLQLSRNQYSQPSGKESDTPGDYLTGSSGNKLEGIAIWIYKSLGPSWPESEHQECLNK